MKFGKNLSLVVEISDPEWAPFWINYKFLKKKINDIVIAQGGAKTSPRSQNMNPNEIAKSSREVEFFQAIRYEMKKASEFFSASEQIYRIRQQRVKDGYRMLKESSKQIDKTTWKMLLSACMKLYRDILLLENFAIMNYCGFSKILKKHDKLTGFSTREAFMRNVMSTQNFTYYPYVMECIKEAEKLFADIQAMESTVLLQDEEKLFIEAIRDLNYQASKLQAEEKEADATVDTVVTGGVQEVITKKSRLFPNSQAEGMAIAALEEATSVAFLAAEKVNKVVAPDIQVALSWMEKIRRKDPPTTKVEGVGSSTDVEDFDNVVVGTKRKLSNSSLATGIAEETNSEGSSNSLTKRIAPVKYEIESV